MKNGPPGEDAPTQPAWALLVHGGVFWRHFGYKDESINCVFQDK